MHLPRGRTTDALVAVTAFVWLLTSIAGWRGAVVAWAGFMPAEIWAVAISVEPLRAVLSPLASVFVHADFLQLAFNLLFLLIAGRYVEKALGPIGLLASYAASAYGAALARLLITPGSTEIGIGANAATFGLIGAYLMLFGIPAAINLGRGSSRPVQIAMLAGIWIGIQLAFSLAAGVFQLSANIVGPLGGLATGVLVAKPLLAWRYRSA